MVLWRIILLLILAVSIRVHSQFDSNGFLSIDCGLPANSKYDDSGTGLKYISDEQFINTGNYSQISSTYVTFNQPKEYLTVRYFPNGTRNCYTIRSLRQGLKYLVRATFIYGNYDKLYRPPIFDIYLGVNFWQTVNSNLNYYYEIMVEATSDYLEVCLVNVGNGNPFISSLHLRQLKGTHPFVNSTQSLVLMYRNNNGAGKQELVRYPDDMNDRWWWNYTYSEWNEISTSSTVAPDDYFKTPSLVLQTAATTSSTKEPLNNIWYSDDKSTKYYVILHFNEIQTLLTGRREFNVLVNGINEFTEPIIPKPSFSLWTTHLMSGYTSYTVSLVATTNSTLPPLLNAFELYKIAPVEVTTYGADVAAINIVNEYHNLKGWWSGDPCLPRQFHWSSVNCSTDSSNITRITGLTLSFSYLTGQLSDSIGNLTALEYLNLAFNELSGSLPSSLDKLTALKFLDIRGNPKLLTTLPPELQKKQQNGSMTYRFDDVKMDPSSPKKNVITIAITVVVLFLVIAVALAIIMVLKRRKYIRLLVQNQNESHESGPLPNDHAKNYTNIPQGGISNGKPQLKGAEQMFPNFENRKFSYDALQIITNGFKNNIGTGGFGSVYLGQVENGIQVAVKVLSQSSTQGVREFLAEVESLTRVHHKNLVSLMGYCIDENCMALVYEYMVEGNLHDKLKDNQTPLSWKQRLRIAYESALGLEYLHKACNPPLIHRDVKTSNILLNENLEAKIADFGLSRAFNSDATSHFSTRIVGTPGYLDPEYYLSNQLSVKSDVFSFGVVLLEIITGRPPINTEGDNLIQWVHQKLSGGDIESIVDPRMQDKYDINSVWKVTDLACRCTEPTSSERPTMTVVAAEINESMDLVISMEEMHNQSNENLLTHVSQDSDFEMAYLGGIPAIGPIVR